MTRGVKALLIVVALAFALGMVYLSGQSEDAHEALTPRTTTHEEAEGLAEAPLGAPVPGVTQTGRISSEEPRSNPASLQPDRTVSVIVRTRFRHGGSAASGVSFELGLGRKASYGREVLLRAETGADGTYRGDLELPEHSVKDRLFVRPTEAGVKRKTVLTKIPEDGEGVDIDLNLEEGCTIEGVVHSQSGEPESEVRVILRTDREHLGIFPSGWFSRSDEAGRFELHHAGVGKGFVRAQKSRVGNALAGGLDFQTCTPDEPLVLTLQGSGILAGRAVTPDGKPVGQVSLTLRQVGSETAHSIAETEHRGTGLLGGDRQTSESGEFRFTGLEPGEYAFVLRQPDGTLERVTEQNFRTDNESIELELRSHRLAVTVLEHDGTPIRDVSWFNADGFSPKAELLFEWSNSQDRNPLWTGAHPDQRIGDAWVLHVEPGWTVRYAAYRSTGSTRRESVTIGEEDWFTERAITLPKPTESGELSLRLITEPPSIPDTSRVELRDSQGVLVLDLQGATDWPLLQVSHALAAGDYSATAVANGNGGYVARRAEVRVRGGETTPLELVLQSGGTVQFSVTCEQPPRDARLAQLYEESSAWLDQRSRVWPNLPGAVFRVQSTGTPLTVKNPTHTEPAEWIPIGGRAVLESAFPPGDHNISVEYPGYLPVLVTVTTELGKQAHVEVALVPE